MTQTMTVSIDGVSVEMPVLPGRRVAAAIKACEGLHTQGLESMVSIGDSIAEMQHRATLKELELHTQRDELLAALTSLVLFTKPKPFNAAALNNAHQTIAKATGGAV